MKNIKILMFAGVLASSLGISAISAEIETSNKNYPRLTYKDNQVKPVQFLFEKYKNDSEVMKLAKLLPPKNQNEQVARLSAQKDPRNLQAPNLYFSIVTQMLEYNVHDVDLFASEVQGLNTPEARLRQNELANAAKDLDKKLWTESLSILSNSKEKRLLDRFLVDSNGNIKSRTILSDIVLCGQLIHHIVNENGLAPVLFLGRTPVFLKLAYDLIKNNDNETISISFSGTPDMENPRKDTFFTENSKKTVARNLVTQNKLKFYCQYLDTKGMKNIKKMYLVDSLDTGGSINSFMNLLRYYYLSYLGYENVPDVHFLGIGLNKNEKILYDYDLDRQTITFKENLSNNVVGLEMRATPLAIHERTLNMILDNDGIQEQYTETIEFPAQKWVPQYKKHLAVGGDDHKSMHEYLIPKMQKIVDIHKILKQKL